MAALERAVPRRDEEEALRLLCVLVPTFHRAEPSGDDAVAPPSCGRRWPL